MPWTTLQFCGKRQDKYRKRASFCDFQRANFCTHLPRPILWLSFFIELFSIIFSIIWHRRRSIMHLKHYKECICLHDFAEIKSIWLKLRKIKSVLRFPLNIPKKLMPAVMQNRNGGIRFKFSISNIGTSWTRSHWIFFFNWKWYSMNCVERLTCLG